MGPARNDNTLTRGFQVKEELANDADFFKPYSVAAETDKAAVA
jgi:hypothetical protein